MHRLAKYFEYGIKFINSFQVKLRKTDKIPIPYSKFSFITKNNLL